MARRHVSSVLILACFLTSILAGLASRQQDSDEGSATVGFSTTLSQASDFATVVYHKLMEYAASKESFLPIGGVGLLVGALAVCTLYVLSRIFDPEPYLYKGKTGRLEAQSIYMSKKSC